MSVEKAELGSGSRLLILCLVRPSDALPREAFARGGRFLRVVTLSDKLTIRNAFLDRRFRL